MNGIEGFPKAFRGCLLKDIRDRHRFLSILRPESVDEVERFIVMRVVSATGYQRGGVKMEYCAVSSQENPWVEIKQNACDSASISDMCSWAEAN